MVNFHFIRVVSGVGFSGFGKGKNHFNGVLKLFLQAVGLSAVVVIYFVVRAIRMKRRKTKK